MKQLNLALQGGGAHGAFTWGVLDGLLEDGRVDIEAVSATSAGATNAVAYAYGHARGGADGAHETLETFWQEVARAGAFYSPVKRTPWEMMAAYNPFFPSWALDHSVSFVWFEIFTRMASPYQFNPLQINPLGDILDRVIDFSVLRACEDKLFISATNVRTGTARVFRTGEITQDVVLASAALPFLFQAVEIDGEHYWDGGYMGNPSLYPLFYHAACRDILIVHVNPIIREKIPTEPYEIENRLNEISFNSSLLKELRAIEFVKKLINQDMLKDEYKNRYRDMLIHAIRADEVLGDLSVASKFDANWHFLLYLRDLGREEAKKWLDRHFDDIGARTTVDIYRDYLGLPG